MTENELVDVIGSFKREPVRLVAGKGPPELSMPRELTESAPWDGYVDEDDDDICLVDFGESFFQPTSSRHIAQPPDQRAPESIFETHIDYKADLWRAGMIVRTLRLRSSHVPGDDNCLPSASHRSIHWSFARVSSSP
jgi:serine/threonine-protein kinase SRPK3